MVYMLVGIQGSGKSTYARKMNKENSIEIISSDLIRQQFVGIKEPLVWSFLYLWCANRIRSNKDFIFDATNINKKVRHRFFENMQKYGLNPDVTAVVFKVDVEESIKRVKLRNEDPNELFLPIEVIQSYAYSMEEVTMDEGFKNIIHIEI